MNKAQQDIRRKKRVLDHAARIGNVRKTCRYFGVARSGFRAVSTTLRQPDSAFTVATPCWRRA